MDYGHNPTAKTRPVRKTRHHGEVTAVADNPRLAALDLAITAVDGTLFDALPKMVWALWLDDENRAAKMHLQFNVLKSVPTKTTITDGNGNERTLLRDTLAAGMLYIMDRGCAQYSLLDDIINAKSSYVVRVDNNAAYEIIEQRLVIVHVSDTSGRKRKPKMSSKKTFRTTQADYDMLLATDLLDIDAELVAELYRSRWQIELFFRWFKKILEADKLLCLTKNGLTIVAYCALIASLLAVLWTGRKPNIRTYELICFYFMDVIDEDELIRHLAALEAAKP